MVLIENPPLVSFSLVIKYQSEKILTFSDMARLEDEVSKVYHNKPRINLISSVGGSIDFRINPITYTSEDNKNKLDIFNDSVVFTSVEYSTWTDMKTRILDQFNELKKIVGISKLTNISLHYIDDFNLSTDNFSIDKYFNLNINIPDRLALDYTDFHLGIKLKNNDDQNYIIKLRGLKPKEDEKYHFRIESYYSKNIDLLIAQNDELSSELEDIHDKLEIDFGEIISSETKKNIGYKG